MHSSQLTTKWDHLTGYIYLLPSFLFFSVFVIYPVFFILYGSMFEWSTMAKMTYVGIGNYAKLLHDSVFRITLRNTLYWIVFTILFQLLIGGFIAYIIEEKLKKYKQFFRTLFFLPLVASVVVIAIVWTQMYSPYLGIITGFFKSIGIKGTFDFLGAPQSAIFSIIVVNVWQWMGFSMLMYIAGLNNISIDVKEAAKIDGASGLKLIVRIYVPLLASVHKSLIMLSIIGSLQTFALVYSMTSGGPNNASEMPGTYIFRQGFTVQQMGYACTISVAILTLSILFTALQLIFRRSGGTMRGRGRA